ncbi:MAG: hypothetical protein ACKOWF_09095 [Chloroflexota bacterium]
MATREELDALTPELRHAAARDFMAALEQVWAGLADLTDEEVSELERELNDAVDAGVRRHAIELQRRAS